MHTYLKLYHPRLNLEQVREELMLHPKATNLKNVEINKII